MRLILSIAALAALAGCASSATPAATTTATTTPAKPVAAAAAAAPTKTSATMTAEEKKAAGYKCDMVKVLGKNATDRVCTTRAEREAAAEAGKESRDELRNYRGGQNITQ